MLFAGSHASSVGTLTYLNYIQTKQYIKEDSAEYPRSAQLSYFFAPAIKLLAVYYGFTVQVTYHDGNF